MLSTIKSNNQNIYFKDKYKSLRVDSDSFSISKAFKNNYYFYTADVFKKGFIYNTIFIIY